ncbi:MAG: hypothetical protein HC819_21630 [Cyclobacteriaceae bacterium]|nr:hypothetical protein [Cyclobacteriaceae bacterium]
MKKTIAILFVLIILAAGAFYYFRIQQRKHLDIWKVVPSSAIIAYENNSLVEDWNTIVDKSIWKTLRKMPYFHAWEQNLANADSISGKDGTLDKLFRNRAFIISAHITSAKEFDFLFSLDLNDPPGKSTFSKLIDSMLGNHSLSSKSRNYQGLELNELVDKTSKSTFTYFIHENIVVGSFTPFLVEDVVRNVSEGYNDTFKSQIPALEAISKLENDEGNIYIDFAKLPDLISGFVNSDSKGTVGMDHFSGDTYLDIKMTDHELLLNGVSTVDLTSSRSYIGTFRNQNPTRIRVTDLLPNATALLYHVTFSDFEEWQNQLTRYWSAVDTAQFRKSQDFIDRYDMKLDWVGHEAANAVLETHNRENPDQLVFVAIEDKNLAFEEMHRFANKLSTEMGDSVYIELYNDQPIVQLPFREFPAMLVGNYFEGFENSYATIFDNYLVVGNSMQVVKQFYSDLENENNWGKSVRQSNFLENTLSEASFSLMINTSLAWPMLMRKLNDKWGGVFKNYEEPLKSFDMMALQVSNLDQRFYTSVAIGHQEQIAAAPKSARLSKTQSIYTLSPIVTKPFIVKNHNNNKFEVLVQDSLNILYQISNEGEILWGDSLRQRIVSNIDQVDYFKNSKLQYLFATNSQIHLLDRNGDYLENYPLKMKKGIELQHLSVIDYDNSKRYRWLAADSQGNMYMYDKEGNNLEGWQPRTMDGPLAVAPFHLRVKGGDCIIALQTNGVLNVMNRRGEMLPGFPFDLKAHGVKDLFVNIGNDFNSTQLVTVSEEGELIAINLKAKLVQREQLYKPGSESKFWLVKDALNKTYLIARQEYNKISLLDRKGELFMEKDLISSGDLFVQYYNFSNDNQIIVVIDREQEFAFVYDRDFEPISFEPSECSHPVGLLYQSRQQEYLLYKCFRNNFSIEVFK